MRISAQEELARLCRPSIASFHNQNEGYNIFAMVMMRMELCLIFLEVCLHTFAAQADYFDEDAPRNLLLGAWTFAADKAHPNSFFPLENVYKGVS